MHEQCIKCPFSHFKYPESAPIGIPLDAGLDPDVHAKIKRFAYQICLYIHGCYGDGRVVNKIWL